MKQELAPAGALAGGGGSSSAGGSSTRNLAEADSASGVQCKEGGPSRSGGSTDSGCGGMVDLVSSGSESEGGGGGGGGGEGEAKGVHALRHLPHRRSSGCAGSTRPW